jgi:hypothetical protein
MCTELVVDRLLVFEKVHERKKIGLKEVSLDISVQYLPRVEELKP